MVFVFRQSAHMAVMEGIMSLFVKEIVSADRVQLAVRKFADAPAGAANADLKDAEQAMLFWINRSCAALKKRLVDEKEAHVKSTTLYPFFFFTHYIRLFVVDCPFLKVTVMKC